MNSSTSIHVDATVEERSSFVNSRPRPETQSPAYEVLDLKRELNAVVIRRDNGAR